MCIRDSPCVVDGTINTTRNNGYSRPADRCQRAAQSIPQIAYPLPADTIHPSNSRHVIDGYDCRHGSGNQRGCNDGSYWNGNFRSARLACIIQEAADRTERKSVSTAANTTAGPSINLAVCLFDASRKSGVSAESPTWPGSIVKSTAFHLIFDLTRPCPVKWFLFEISVGIQSSLTTCTVKTNLYATCPPFH